MDSQVNNANLSADEINDLLNKDIIDLVGLSDADEAKKNEIRQSMIETVENRVYASLYDILQKINRWSEFEKADEEERDKILEAEGINTERLFVQESLLYKIEMVEARKLVGIGFEPIVPD